jgi:hypothetical protein
MLLAQENSVDFVSAAAAAGRDTLRQSVGDWGLDGRSAGFRPSLRCGRNGRDTLRRDRLLGWNFLARGQLQATHRAHRRPLACPGTFTMEGSTGMGRDQRRDPGPASQWVSCRQRQRSPANPLGRRSLCNAHEARRLRVRQVSAGRPGTQDCRARTAPITLARYPRRK